ncbi:hypothetical protein RSK20926_00510 [Roseobacter sp. SK209-2-6]|uniref:hypothetical protein n=1 Tax=Roseobacter sp. SK209-2-6 TaxID=388739 RepID=UPI0000F3C2CA|nr:hypothetical protein [Roseobacter sp. SK209-2-6]EBA15388.1 hypothetical protein RSK20926_00510 [Roseobacter sp. SK209-2-6]
MSDENAVGETISLEGRLTRKDLRGLRPRGAIRQFHAGRGCLFDIKKARELCTWPSIQEVELWCDVTKAAFRELMSVRGLEELHVLNLRTHGGLQGMPLPASLSTVGVGWATSGDLQQIARLTGLKSLRAENSGLSTRAVSALLEMDSLESLDLGASNLDDGLAETLSHSGSIQRLFIQGTRVTSSGLKRVCAMKQLRELDIWALRIEEKDLEMLSELPNLEYLSVGGYDNQTELTAEGVLPRIEKLPALKSIWLDGIRVPDADVSRLREKYEHVQVSFCDYSE